MMRKVAADQRARAHQDNLDIAKLSENLKERLEQTGYKQDNQLEQLYQQSQRIFAEEMEKTTREKTKLTERLRKKKDECKAAEEKLTKLLGKKKADSGTQCNMEKEEKLKFHSRPKPPLLKLGAVFEEVMLG